MIVEDKKEMHRDERGGDLVKPTGRAVREGERKGIANAFFTIYSKSFLNFVPTATKNE
jgi:hypothetical protein